MDLSKKESEKLIEFFDELNNSEISYVVLRKYEDLPQKCKDGDIDILTDDLDKMKNLGEALNFREKKLDFASNLLIIIRKLFSSPISISQTFISNPKGSILRIFNSDISTPELEEIKEDKIYYRNIVVHMTERVHYKSTLNDKRVLTTDKINRSLLTNSRKIENEGISFNIPSSYDEICHLVSRGIFDYEGDFPVYYSNKIRKIFSELSSKDKNNLEDLLSEIFFQASSKMVSELEKDNIENLRESLKRFSKY